MNHDAFHELLALGLYDELSLEQRHELDRHLAGCDACRGFEAELARGLGCLVAHPHAAPLRVRPDVAHTRERLRTRAKLVLAFAAGLAAGVLGMATLRPGARPPAPVDVAALRHDAPPFAPRADRPPPANGLGPLARLGGWLRR